MGATLEVVTGTLRAGPDHHAYGDPWDFAATVQIMGSSAYISAARGTYGPETARALRDVLRARGVTKVVFHRQKAGHSYDVIIGGGEDGDNLERTGG